MPRPCSRPSHAKRSARRTHGAAASNPGPAAHSAALASGLGPRRSAGGPRGITRHALWTLSALLPESAGLKGTEQTSAGSSRREALERVAVRRQQTGFRSPLRTSTTGSRPRSRTSSPSTRPHLASCSRPRRPPTWSRSSRRCDRYAAAGSVNQNVEPSPSRLRTPMSPPWAATSCLQMYRPRPRPPRGDDRPFQ